MLNEESQLGCVGAAVVVSICYPERSRLKTIDAECLQIAIKEHFRHDGSFTVQLRTKGSFITMGDGLYRIVSSLKDGSGHLVDQVDFDGCKVAMVQPSVAALPAQRESLLRHCRPSIVTISIE
jgi:hypothetical protein